MYNTPVTMANFTNRDKNLSWGIFSKVTLRLSAQFAVFSLYCGQISLCLSVCNIPLVQLLLFSLIRTSSVCYNIRPKTKQVSLLQFYLNYCIHQGFEMLWLKYRRCWPQGSSASDVMHWKLAFFKLVLVAAASNWTCLLVGQSLQFLLQ